MIEVLNADKILWQETGSESRPLRRDSFLPFQGVTRFYYARQPLTRAIGGLNGELCIFI